MIEDIKINMEITERGFNALRKLINENCLEDQILCIAYVKTIMHGDAHAQWRILFPHESKLEDTVMFSFVISGFKFYCSVVHKDWAVNELNNKILDADKANIVFYDKDKSKSQRHPGWGI